MRELIELAQNNIPWLAVVLVVASLFFEFSKIRINPLTWLFKEFQKKILEEDVKEHEAIHKENVDINKRLDEVVYIKSKHYQDIVKWQSATDGDVNDLKVITSQMVTMMNEISTKLDKMYEDQDANEMVRLRWEILSFADSCRSGNKHSKDAFHHIIESNDKYHRIIEKRGFVNGVIDAEMEYIKEAYHHCCDTDDFA